MNKLSLRKSDYIGLRIFLITCLGWMAVQCMAQNKPEFDVSKIDSALLKNANAVIRNELVTYHIISPREYTWETKRIVSVLHENSHQAYVIVPYNKYSKAEIVFINLYDEHGIFIRKIKKSEFMDESGTSDMSILDDTRYLGVRSFGGKFPYTLEYEWKITFKQSMAYPDWRPVDGSTAVAEATFVLNTPVENIVHTRTYNYEFDIKEEVTDGRKKSSWTLHNVGAIRSENSGPPDFEIYPQLSFAPSVFEVESWRGSMDSWREFGKFLYELNKGQETVSPYMNDFIMRMTQSCKTDREKIEVIYHWLQENMRYVSIQLGIGGWRSLDADFVEQNKFGDCKALSTFMKGLLQVVGITSYQAAIKFCPEPSFYEGDFVSNDFNHMMLYLPEQNMWLECTSNNTPAGIIHEYEQNKVALLITPEGGQIITTPVSRPESNRIVTSDTILFSDPFYIKGHTTYYGNMDSDIRDLHFAYSTEERKRIFLESFQLAVKSLQNFSTYAQPDTPVTHLDYSAELNHFGSASGIRHFIPVNQIHPPANISSTSIRRSMDFISIDNYVQSNDIYIFLPADYEIEYLPEAKSLAYKGNTYRVDLSFENHIIHVHHEMTEVPMRLTPAEFKELNTYYSQIAKSNDQKIVIKKSRT